MKKILTMMVAAFFGCPLFATTWYVNGTNGSDGYSGKSSGSAKKTIQAAIDAASSGDSILVAAGTYDPINAVGKVLTIRSVSGASLTIIDGKGTKRCAWLSDEEGYFGPPLESSGAFDSVLEGFTLVNGFSHKVSDDDNGGGGVCGGCVIDCVIRQCFASDGGGGAKNAKLYRCTVVENTASDDAGGCWLCLVYDSLICRNTSLNGYGGGAGSAATASKLYNCTLTQNVAYENGCDEVGAIDYYMSAYNCIVWANVTDKGRTANITSAWGEYYGDDVNNYTSDPHFVDAANGDYRLAADSPCIDAGDNSYVTSETDLNGNARIVGGKVDIGCYEYAARPSKAPLYMVIDLSGGTTASSFPISYLDAVPAGGWTDEYKTTKLVMRRIEPGTFVMGCTSDEVGFWGDDALNAVCTVTLTKPYYIGVFQVTQRQYELVTGKTPSYYSGSTRPVETVSYDILRGTDKGSQWPQSSEVDSGTFMAVIRQKTAINTFDLPTDAQWEYACRAGTTTALNNGTNLQDEFEDSELDKLAQYRYRGTGTSVVGSYLPNAWGLYDMHGNVWEWCLDWYGHGDGVPMVDPVGPTQPIDWSDPARVFRGGAHNRDARECRSGHRAAYACYRVSHLSGDFGFRLAMTSNGSVGDLLGLVAHYKFDGNANDSSANGYNLTSCEDCGLPVLTSDRNGNANSAYLFDGAKAQRLGNVDEVQRMNAPRSTFTFALWFQTEASYADYGAGWAWNLGNYAFAPINGDVIESGLAGLGVKVGRDGIEVVEHSGYYMPTVLSYYKTIGTAWNHLAVTIENDGKPILYLNGVKVGEGEKTDRVKCVWADAVGGFDWGYYTGKVDDLRIYNRALSAVEVKALYEGDEGCGGDCSPGDEGDGGGAGVKDPFDGNEKHVFNGFVRDKKKSPCGLIQVTTAKATKKGVKVSGFVMLEDGKKVTMKAVTVAVEKKQLKVSTTVGKLGSISLTIGGKGFAGTLGDKKVASEKLDEDAGVLKTTVKVTYLDAATGKLKTKNMTLGGITVGGDAAGTLSQKNSSTRAFQAETECDSCRPN